VFDLYLNEAKSVTLSSPVLAILAVPSAALDSLAAGTLTSAAYFATASTNSAAGLLHQRRQPRDPPGVLARRTVGWLPYHGAGSLDAHYMRVCDTAAAMLRNPLTRLDFSL
jgi:hypothetical protein